MPELLDDEYLHEFFDEIGRVKQEESGLSAVPWQEIKAWNEITGNCCDSWDLVTLQKMSNGYANQFNCSDDQDREPPVPLETEKSEKASEARAERFKNFLDSHVKNK